MSRRSKFLCLLAALLLAVMPVCAEEAAETPAVPAAEEAVEATIPEVPAEPAEPAAPALPEGIPDTYRLVVEGESYNMYLREDCMAIVLESRENGALLFSGVEEGSMAAAALCQAQSGVVTQYLAAGSSSISTETVDLLSEGNTQVHTIEYDFSVPNGFRASINYTAIGIGYDVIVELNGSDLKVTVPHDSIREEQKSTYRLATITLFPFMGSSFQGQDTGYMLIPDGQGALIELKNNEKRYRSLYFDEPVYGKKIKDDKNDAGNTPNAVDSEPDIMPVFGIAHTEKGIAFLGVIEQGDVGASIRVYPNGAVNLAYDRANAQFEYNYRFTQMMGTSAGAGGMDAFMPESRSFDIVEHFLLLSGSQANYTGMAIAYRDYLDQNGFFASAEMTPFDVQIDVLCLERENFVLGKQDVVMSTFEQTAAILADLRSKGAGNLSLVVRGWQEGGLSAALPTDSYAPAASLGGSGGMKTLLESAASRKIPVMLECNFLYANIDTHPTMIYSVFKKIDSQTWNRSLHRQVYPTRHYVTPSRSLELAGSVFAQMHSHGVPGVSLVGLPSFLSDYYESNTVKDAVSMAGVYGQVCASAAENGMSARLAAANAYLWPYAASLSDLPVTGSDFIFTTCDVPFLTIALSGRIPCYAEYTNFQANTNRFFLRLVEQGARPAFLLTMEDPIELKNTNSTDVYSSRYELYGDMIVSWSQELDALHQKLGYASIIGHEMDGDLTHVTWSNGVEVYLNFGDEALTVNGESLAPMSYMVKEGGM